MAKAVLRVRLSTLLTGIDLIDRHVGGVGMGGDL